VLLVIVRWLLLILVITFGAYQIAHQWQQFSHALRSVSVVALVASFLLLLAGQTAGTLSWQQLLEDLGEPIGRRRAAQVFLVGQLGKYVPGSIWAYLLQMELGRRYRIARARVFTASLFAVGIAVVVSLLLGLLALPVLVAGHRDLLWLYLLLPIGLGCLHPRVMSTLASLVFKLMRKDALQDQLRMTVVIRAALWSAVSYCCFGLHLYLLVNALAHPGFHGLGICVGAMAVGLTAGLFAFVLPSGVGVREAVLIACLVTLVTAPQAGAVALLSRVLFIISDLTMAGLAAAFSSGAARERSAQPDSAQSDSAQTPVTPC